LHFLDGLEPGAPALDAEMLVEEREVVGGVWTAFAVSEVGILRL
jgi:hypothetical protein